MNRPELDVAAPLAGADATLPDYHQDFDLWLRAQATLLRERRFDLLDVDNLVEEVEGMSISQHRELRSRLDVILAHLLKLKFQPGHKSNNWLGTLEEQRKQIRELIADSPSLRRRVGEYAERVYLDAVRTAARETKLAPSTFPPENPFSVAQLLDLDYLP